MANFLTLTNMVQRRFGSQTVTDANFANTNDPIVVAAKNAVNDAVAEINYYEFEWPFNNVEGTVTCVAGTSSYALPAAKTVDWQSFILQQSDVLGVSTKRLEEISYDDWLDSLAESDGNATSADYDVPTYVYRTPNDQIGLSAIPDQAYTINYQYYAIPTRLVAAADIPTIPDMYSGVIVSGACKYMAAHRGNDTQQQLYERQFEKGISRMRSILINNWVTIRDTRIPRRRGSASFIRVKNA